MATAYRAGNANSSATGTAVSVTAPTGTTTGDAVICIVHVNTDTTIADNNGSTPFTEDINDYKPNPGNGHTQSIFSRIIQAGDPTTYNFTSGASGRWGIVAMTFSDPDPSIYDVAPTTANASNVDDPGSGTGVTDSITTNTANAFHIVSCGWDTSAIGTITTPSGYTLIGNANGGGEPLHASYKLIASQGATGTTSIVNTEFGARICFSFAVKSKVISTVRRLALLGVGQ